MSSLTTPPSRVTNSTPTLSLQNIAKALLALIIGIGFSGAIAIYSYFLFANQRNIEREFESTDLSTHPLPEPFFQRNIDFVFADDQPLYIFGPKHSGKSTLGIHIAHRCVENHIPFIYAQAGGTGVAEPCYALAKSMGYYKDHFFSYWVPESNVPDCHFKSNKKNRFGILDAFSAAAKRVKGKPYLILDDIEKFKAEDDKTEFESLCEFARYAKSEMKFILLSTGDTRFKLPSICRDFRDVFATRFIGHLTEEESIDYLTQQCNKTAVDACIVYHTLGGKLEHLHNICIDTIPFESRQSRQRQNIQAEMQEVSVNPIFAQVGKKILNGHNKIKDFVDNPEQLEFLLNDAERFFTQNEESEWIFTETMVKTVFMNLYDIDTEISHQTYCQKYTINNDL